MFTVHALKRYSQLRADAAREVAHGFVGIFKPELYWHFKVEDERRFKYNLAVVGHFWKKRRLTTPYREA